MAPMFTELSKHIIYAARYSVKQQQEYFTILQIKYG